MTLKIRQQGKLASTPTRTSSSVSTFATGLSETFVPGKIALLLFLALAMGHSICSLDLVSIERIQQRELGDVPLTSSLSTDNKSEHSLSCQKKLDQLDQLHNERRRARQRVLEEMRAAGENDIYKHLWLNGENPDSKIHKRMYGTKKFDLFEPEATCLTEERFGGDSDLRHHAFGDGPKFLCALDYLRDVYIPKQNLGHPLNQTDCLAYSVGSRNKVQFERGIYNQLRCETHTFDPTLPSGFSGGEYAIFHDWGLGTDGEHVNFRQFSFTTMSLERIMKELGHTGRKIDILKIDIEGSEYKAMPAVFESIAQGKLEVDQILIELHAQEYETIAKFFEGADRAKMRVFHKERNGWGCGGTSCVEYALVSESFLRRATAFTIC